ncbi:MAG: hypothetical protein J6V17_01085 [Bacteroidales bacterium]|nr:hypothetical protein [Bacteroidales bacterium]
MKKLTEFISTHLSDDTSKLLLSGKKWPEIDMELAVNCIESRKKLKGKVQEWYDEPELIFPRKLSAEQCSSSATAYYKAVLAEHIALDSSESIKVEGKRNNSWKIADLTGGLGVDSWYFSKRAPEVLYNEMLTPLCEAAKHNFIVLGSGNIIVSNSAVVPEGSSTPEDGYLSPSALLSEFKPDIVFMDPARRAESGKKVFLIEECTPDVLTLKDEIFAISRHILIKLSPMADISMVCDRLGHTCREVHVVATGGECKELLIWMDREWTSEYSVHAIELQNDYPQSIPAAFSFLPSEERETGSQALHDVNINVTPDRIMDLYMFEPGKAMMKSGAFNLIGIRFNIVKLGKSTHYYLTDDKNKAETLKSFGKVYRIIRMEPLDKRSIRTTGKEFPKAEVTARNIPMDTETLRKKLGVTSGGNTHIFGLKSDLSGNILLCAERMF